MTPPHNDHFFAQASIYDSLRNKIPGGMVLQEAVIQTEDGNKVADGVWMSDAFLKAHKGQASFKRAPEICVEVKSPSNSMRELMEKRTCTSMPGRWKFGFGKNPARCVSSILLGR